MIRNKNTRNIDEYSVVLTLYKGDEKVKLTPELINHILNSINKDINNWGPGLVCNRQGWNDEATVFLRANKPKKFTPAQAEEIKKYPATIKKKAEHFKTSTKTVMDIMKDRYFK